MGAAFNAMMEECSKEWLASRCCELMAESRILRRALELVARETWVAVSVEHSVNGFVERVRQAADGKL